MQALTKERDLLVQREKMECNNSVMEVAGKSLDEWSIAPHDTHTTVASTSGSDVNYIWDTTDGTLAAIIPHAYEGNTYALVRSHMGDFLVTGGEDGSVHMFDISNCAEDGILKVASWVPHSGLFVDSSRPLGCIILAVVDDTKLLVAGGTNGFIQCWKAVEEISHLFDLKDSQCQKSEFRLLEHEGPVTCLGLDLTRIYSGSWDMTVRIWDRALLKCVMVLRHSDWVWSIAPHDTTIASTSGSDVYIWDTTDGTLAAIIPHAHEGNTHALVRSHMGEILFTGGEDGLIHMFDISDCAEDGILKVASWVPHSGPVNSLAFEFPWVVSASRDGKLSLIDVRKLLKSTRRSLMKHHNRKEATIEAPQRMLQGSGKSSFSEDHVVKMWDFSRALEREMRARAQRALRLENRMGQRRLKAEMNAKSGKAKKCSVAAKKNPINGERIGIWHCKRSVKGKVKKLSRKN